MKKYFSLLNQLIFTDNQFILTDLDLESKLIVISGIFIADSYL